jgi:hypothetical protein
MEHIYQKIENFYGFNYENLFTEMVNRFDNAHFVEIGTAIGKSTMYLGVEIINSNKNIKYDTYDCQRKYNKEEWCPSTLEVLENPNLEELPEEEDSSWQNYLHNINPIKHIVNSYREYSVIASKKYENESLDFVFIDGNHSFEEVVMDINHWLPKIKKNGVLAGHDYTDENYAVRNAVNSIFNKDKIRIDGSCWVIEKSNLI